MYTYFKASIKGLIPKKILFKNELFFRFFHGVFYLGNKHKCNICAKNLRAFIVLKNQDLLCPFCGSLSRNRRLWFLLNQKKYLKGNVLHFSPSRSLFRMLKKMKSINYFSSDFEDEFLADYKFDITKIDQNPNKFDIIICYHILEHITDDKKAMAELYRVLKPDGTIFIQTPLKTGNIYEDDCITTPEARIKHFGQHDHVRIYSAEGLMDRLTSQGLKVSVKHYQAQKNDFYFGFKSPETVLIVTK